MHENSHSWLGVSAADLVSVMKKWCVCILKSLSENGELYRGIKSCIAIQVYMCRKFPLSCVAFESAAVGIAYINYDLDEIPPCSHLNKNAVKHQLYSFVNAWPHAQNSMRITVAFVMGTKVHLNKHRTELDFVHHPIPSNIHAVVIWGMKRRKTSKIETNSLHVIFYCRSR